MSRWNNWKVFLFLWFTVQSNYFCAKLYVTIWTIKILLSFKNWDMSFLVQYLYCIHYIWKASVVPNYSIIYIFRIVMQEGLEEPAQRQCMPKWWRRCAMKPSLIRKGTKEWHPETTLLACLSPLLIEWQKSWSWILIPEKRFVCIPFHFYQFWVIHTS